MTKRAFILSLLWIIAVVCTARTTPLPVATAVARFPFPQHVSYAPETIRPDHRSQAEQDDDVRAFYEHWKSNYLVEAGTTAENHPLYRVSFGSADPSGTVSEGQGYGMIIMALMAGYDAQAQTIFDGLWEFSRAHPSDIDERLMGWRVPEVAGSNASAFDGDADIAYGLLLADKQWGSNGRISYKMAATQVITAILESTIGPQSRLPMLGDWVQPGGTPHNQYTPRSSDFMPAHFRAYGRATSNPVWTTVTANVQAAIAAFQAGHSPTSGLLPDFLVPVSGQDHTLQPAPPYFLEGEHDGHYYYNAGRDPWRIGVDVLLNNDPVSRTQAGKISTWAETAAGGIATNIKPGYLLDGTPIPPSDYFTTFFAAPLGVAAMTNPDQQQWLNHIYDAVRTTHGDYYADSVTLLNLLVMTGNYWDPTTMVDDSLDHAIFLPTILVPAKSESPLSQP